MSLDWQMLESIRDEVRNGFRELSYRLDGTNNRLDETNHRLDQTNLRLDETNHKLDAQIVRLDQHTVQLDEHTTRLGSLESRLTDFQGEVREKLDGIGSYLRSINGSILDHSKRIYKLEHRVDHPENPED